MSDERPPSNVVPFSAASLSVKQRTPETRGRRYCSHFHVAVYPDEPILEYQDCSAVVDPYAYIRTLCDQWNALSRDAERRRDDALREHRELEKVLKVMRAQYASEAERRQGERQLMVLPPQRSAAPRAKD